MNLPTLPAGTAPRVDSVVHGLGRWASQTSDLIYRDPGESFDEEAHLRDGGSQLVLEIVTSCIQNVVGIGFINRHLPLMKKRRMDSVSKAQKCSQTLRVNTENNK